MCIRDSLRTALRNVAERVEVVAFVYRGTPSQQLTVASSDIAAFPEVLEVRYCLLYTSDAADERSSVDLGGRRIIQKTTQQHTHTTQPHKDTSALQYPKS